MEGVGHLKEGRWCVLDLLAACVAGQIHRSLSSDFVILRGGYKVLFAIAVL
jgi:hypothetical protein